MRFVDIVTLKCDAGHGGQGCVAWRREKYVPRGGPFGGNGGRGGNVGFRASGNLGTLLDLKYRKKIHARDGGHGQPKLADGAWGDDVIMPVPIGTLVRDAHTGELLADLSEDGDEIIVARGGKGGLGNAHFKTATNQAPTKAQPGLPGESCTVTLELKLLADIGLIGYPSVGKSTLISVISNARPKIADYPFTTLAPNLGIVQWKDYRSFVVADIPGLIEGAHEGRGLGFQFLRHVERCRALVHLIEVTPPSEIDDGRDPIEDYERINHELAAFSPGLAARPQIVVLSKRDLPFVVEREAELRAHFDALGVPFFTISSATREGLDTLKDAMITLVDDTPAPDASLFTAPETVEAPADDETEAPAPVWDADAGTWVVED